MLLSILSIQCIYTLKGAFSKSRQVPAGTLLEFKNRFYTMNEKVAQMAEEFARKQAFNPPSVLHLVI